MLEYVFDMRRKGDLRAPSPEHRSVTVAVPRPDGWETPTRAMIRAVRLEAFQDEAVRTLEGQGWSISRIRHPRCECDAPTVGASGNCGYCGGSDTPAIPRR